MTSTNTQLRVIPLGGLDEIGKNMTVFEYADDMVLVDAGLMFPDDDHPGIDLILPDYSYVLERKDRLRGIVITHGHEDHIGALPYLLKDLDKTVPVLGTRLTLGLINGKLEEHNLKKVKLREMRPGTHVSLGSFGLDFFAINHSIPDGVAVFLRTPAGNVLHTGDFKFDQTPIDGRLTDYAAFSRAAHQGVTLLLSDSTNAEMSGQTASEAVVGQTLRTIFRQADQRIIVASFASHIHRVQQVCDAAVSCKRKIAITGRSMVNTTRIARDLGYLHISDCDLIDAYAMNDVPSDQVVVLCTGSQGEPLSALARIASGDHPTIKVEPGDTVVISATPVPGNEKAVDRVINRLVKRGATVVHKGIAQVHVSGHAASEELKLMLNLTKPAYFMPIHGETRHLYAHAALAKSVGIPPENIFVLENGDSLLVSPQGVRAGKPVHAGVTYVDGMAIGDLGHMVLRDRQTLSSDGLAIVVIALSLQSGEVVGSPEIITRGLALGGTGPEALDNARTRIDRVLKRMAKEGVTDSAIVKKSVRDSLSQYIWETAHRRPMIVPVVMEV